MVNRWFRRASIGAGLLGLCSLLIGCGSSSPAVGSSSAAGAPSLSPKSLYQQAKQEGTVVWYQADPESEIAPVIQEFEKTYPGVHVSYSEVKPPQIVTDLQVQEAARKVSIDVGEDSDLDIATNVKTGNVANVNWTALGIPSDMIFQSSYVTMNLLPVGVFYNTQKVPASEVPKNWNDLLNPRWKGKLALDGRGTFTSVWVRSGSGLGGAAAGEAFATRLARQKPAYATSLSQIIPEVASGQDLVGTALLGQALLEAKKSGAPIAIAPISPVMGTEEWNWVAKGAPHPAAAELLVKWLASNAGQAAFSNYLDQGYLPPSRSCPGTGTIMNKTLCSMNIRWYVPTTLAEYQALPAYYKKIQQIFGTYAGS